MLKYVVLINHALSYKTNLQAMGLYTLISLNSQTVFMLLIAINRAEQACHVLMYVEIYTLLHDL